MLLTRQEKRKRAEEQPEVKGLCFSQGGKKEKRENYDDSWL